MEQITTNIKGTKMFWLCHERCPLVSNKIKEHKGKMNKSK